MNKIKTEDLKLGDRFSSSVYFDDGKYLVLAEGAPVSKKSFLFCIIGKYLLF